MSVQLIESPVAKNDPTKRANKKQTTSKSSVEDNILKRKMPIRKLSNGLRRIMENLMRMSLLIKTDKYLWEHPIV